MFGGMENSLYLCGKLGDIMSENKVVESIKEVAKNVLPENARLLLYGSRIRGDYSEDSDWDLLVILDKAKIEQSDYDNIVYPLTDLGWGLGESIIPVLYTKKVNLRDRCIDSKE